MSERGVCNRTTKFTAGALALAVAFGFARPAVAEAQSSIRPASAKPVMREASRGPIKIRVSADRDEVHVPETVELSIVLEAERGVDIRFPEFGETLGDFGVKESKDLPEGGDDVIKRIGKVLTLEPFLEGRSTIPGIKLAFEDAREKADGTKEPYKDEVATEPITVTVHTDLADVKGPASLPWPRSFVLVIWIIGLLTAVGLIVFAARWWLRRRAARAHALPARIIPAHEWALAEMDILTAEGLIERGKIREHYYRINAIVRGYVERRWGLLAGEQTSEEFVRALQQSLFLNDDHKAVLRRFIDACDPVKYARVQPAGDEIEWVQRAAREFVVQTAPAAEPEARAEAA